MMRSAFSFVTPDRGGWYATGGGNRMRDSGRPAPQPYSAVTAANAVCARQRHRLVELRQLLMAISHYAHSDGDAAPRSRYFAVKSLLMQTLIRQAIPGAQTNQSEFALCIFSFDSFMYWHSYPKCVVVTADCYRRWSISPVSLSPEQTIQLRSTAGWHSPANGLRHLCRLTWQTAYASKKWRCIAEMNLNRLTPSPRYMRWQSRSRR